MRGPHINPFDPLLSHSWPTLLLLVGLGLIVDLLFGTPKLLGRLPGPDTAISHLATSLRRRLDRPNRSPRERTVRGIIVLVVMLPLLRALGLLLTPFVFENGASAALTALVLSFFLRQRQNWDAVMAAGRATSKTANEAQFGVNRNAVRALVLGFADRGLTNLLLFCVGGFALLLPYRFLRASIDEAAPDGLQKPSSPYFSAMVLVAGILALPAAILSGLMLSAAHIFVPHTNLMAIRGMLMRHPHALAIRTVPMGVIAHGLGVSFRLDGGRDKKARLWLGPEDGTARISALHMRRATLLVMVAWISTLLVAFFLAGFALTA